MMILVGPVFKSLKQGFYLVNVRFYLLLHFKLCEQTYAELAEQFAGILL